VIRVARETLSQIRASGELEALLRAHYEEIALYRDRVSLEPDWETYELLEERGRLVCLTGRDDGVLIGYAAFFVFPHPHYRSHIVATNDVIFVRRDQRKGSTAGLRLIRESERVLAEVGAHRVVWHVKPKNDWSAILERLGYHQEEIMMGKLLGAQTWD